MPPVDTHDLEVRIVRLETTIGDKDSGLVSDIQSRIIVNVAKRTTAAPLGLISPYIPTQDR